MINGTVVCVWRPRFERPIPIPLFPSSFPLMQDDLGAVARGRADAGAAPGVGGRGDDHAARHRGQGEQDGAAGALAVMGAVRGTGSVSLDGYMLRRCCRGMNRPTQSLNPMLCYNRRGSTRSGGSIGPCLSTGIWTTSCNSSASRCVRSEGCVCTHVYVCMLVDRRGESIL